jgi:hypothetical protein
LKEKLSLKKLVCTRHKTKFNYYACFQVSVLADEIPPTKNTGVRPTGCFISPFYNKLTPEQVCYCSTLVKRIKGRAPSVAVFGPSALILLSPAGASQARAESGLNS